LLISVIDFTDVNSGAEPYGVHRPSSPTTQRNRMPSERSAYS